MRAMGPGSVSSLLKIALDVFFVALWVAIGVLIIGAIAFLLIFTGQTLTFTNVADGVIREIRLTGPVLAGCLGAVAAYSAIMLFVVSHLRRVFATLTAGDPFHPSNIGRISLIGLGLAALAVGNVLIRKGFAAVAPGVPTQANAWVDMPTWFSVLVVFVLADVFREGARLRREAELTI